MAHNEQLSAGNLARKYRPTTLSSVVGQAHIVSLLKAEHRATLKADDPSQVSHPVKTIIGESGRGKTTLARLDAMWYFCENRDEEEGDVCGKCAPCQAISSGSGEIIDVIEVDAASRNTKEAVRAILDGFGTSPATGSVKVYIFDEAHMFSKAAANAALKAIEELPKHVRVYFLTTEGDQLLDTLKGRSQVLELAPGSPTPDELADHLLHIAESEGWKLSREVAELLVSATDPALGVRGVVSQLTTLAPFLAEGAELSVTEASELAGLIERSIAAEVLDAVFEGEPAKALALLDKAWARFGEATARELITEARSRWRMSLGTAEADVLRGLLDALGRQMLRPWVELSVAEAAVAASPRAHKEQVTSHAEAVGSSPEEAIPEDDSEAAPPALFSDEAAGEPKAVREDSSPRQRSAELQPSTRKLPSTGSVVMDAIAERATLLEDGSAVYVKLPPVLLDRVKGEPQFQIILDKASEEWDCPVSLIDG